jgi:trans-aconitate methyltransferase
MAQVAMDWQHWLKRWDAQQAEYLPDREEQFQVMLDVLRELMPEEFVALDLACGPGAISQRLLARFPGARCVAVDLDPVLLAMGQATLGTCETSNPRSARLGLKLVSIRLSTGKP